MTLRKMAYMLVELVDLTEVDVKEIPGGLTKEDIMSLNDIVPVRARITENPITPGILLLAHKSIITSIKSFN